jgi:uncharacterized membrane protein YgdD (TMEM256/DUF423 family)
VYTEERGTAERRRNFLFAGAFSAGLAVAAGAFGAHLLSGKLPADRLAVFETAARYQMYHALALLAISSRPASVQSRHLRVAGTLFVAGTVLFCGSLYGVALLDMRGLGAITPFGGLAWLVAWGFLAAAAVRRENLTG